MRQIDQVIKRYQDLKGVPLSLVMWASIDVCKYTDLQAEGKPVAPALAWLMGAVMPLDACGGVYTDDTLQELMEHLQF